MNYEAGLSSKMKDVLFGDIVELITNKVNASEISLNNYISTEENKQMFSQKGAYKEMHTYV